MQELVRIMMVKGPMVVIYVSTLYIVMASAVKIERVRGKHFYKEQRRHS